MLDSLHAGIPLMQGSLPNGCDTHDGMPTEPRHLMIKITCGAEAAERANQGWTVAAMGVAAGARVTVWLTGEAVWFAVPGRQPDLALPHATPVARTGRDGADGRPDRGLHPVRGAARPRRRTTWWMARGSAARPASWRPFWPTTSGPWSTESRTWTSRSRPRPRARRPCRSRLDRWARTPAGDRRRPCRRRRRRDRPAGGGPAQRTPDRLRRRRFPQVRRRRDALDAVGPRNVAVARASARC